MLSVRLSSYGARGKLGEHERSVKARLHMRFSMRFWCDFDAILVAIFDAISNRMCKLPAISWRFHGDLSPRNRRCFEPAQIQMRFCGDFEAKTVLPYPPRVFCRDGGKQWSWRMKFFVTKPTPTKRKTQKEKKLFGQLKWRSLWLASGERRIAYLRPVRLTTSATTKEQLREKRSGEPCSRSSRPLSLVSNFSLMKAFLNSTSFGKLVRY